MSTKKSFWAYTANIQRDDCNLSTGTPIGADSQGRQLTVSATSQQLQTLHRHYTERRVPGRLRPLLKVHLAVLLQASSCLHPVMHFCTWNHWLGGLGIESREMVRMPSSMNPSGQSLVHASPGLRWQSIQSCIHSRAWLHWAGSLVQWPTGCEQWGCYWCRSCPAHLLLKEKTTMVYSENNNGVFWEPQCNNELKCYLLCYCTTKQTIYG